MNQRPHIELFLCSCSPRVSNKGQGKEIIKRSSTILPPGQSSMRNSCQTESCGQERMVTLPLFLPPSLLHFFYNQLLRTITCQALNEEGRTRQTQCLPSVSFKQQKPHYSAAGQTAYLGAQPHSATCELCTWSQLLNSLCLFRKCEYRQIPLLGLLK